MEQQLKESKDINARTVEHFSEDVGTLHYNRNLDPDEIHTVLQSHGKGSSLNGIGMILLTTHSSLMHNLFFHWKKLDLVFENRRKTTQNLRKLTQRYQSSSKA